MIQVFILVPFIWNALPLEYLQSSFRACDYYEKKSAYMDLPGEVFLVSSNNKYAPSQLSKTIQTQLKAMSSNVFGNQADQDLRKKTSLF